MAPINLSRLSDDDLISETKKAIANERQATAHLIALLAEFDERRLYLDQGCSSLFTYCTTVLHLSEHAAYHRIEAARAARRFPVILERLAEGAVTLTAVGLLRPHLTEENQVALLDAARHQTKREVERLIASLAPKPAVVPLVRRLAVIKPLSVAPPERKVSEDDPKSPAGPITEFMLSGVDAPTEDRSSADDQYMLRLTISGATRSKLERARDLLRHSIPNGDPATIVDRALTVMLEQLERTRMAATSRPREGRRSASGTRHVPAAVRRAVWKRDGSRCTFLGFEGRCPETGKLELHHVIPFARGGLSDVANLTLRCRAHNAHEARLEFGAKAAF